MRNIYFQTATGLLALFAAAAVQAAVPSIYPGRLLDANQFPVPASLFRQVQMAVADFNGDGIKDIAVNDDQTTSTAPPTGGVWVFIGQAHGGFTAPAFYATASEPSVLATGDLNGDGFTDIVTGNQGSATADQVSVLINKGDGTFDGRTDYAPDAGATFTPGSIAVADATGDGRPDVVVGASTNAVYIVPGTGDGALDTSATQALATTGAVIGSVLLTDINSDSYPDVVASSCSIDPDRVEVFYGAPDGTFPAAPNQSIAVGACANVAVADVNEDGVPDIAVVNADGDTTLEVLLNTGGTLETSGILYQLPRSPLVLVVSSREPSTADMDDDGHLDILVPGQLTGWVSVLYGNGDGSFRAPVAVPTGFSASDAAAVDANADGKPDIVTANDVESSLAVAENLGNRQFLSYRDYPYQDVSGRGSNAAGMASADFNGDGRPDVVTANSGDDTLSVLVNNQSGGFGAPTILAPAGASDLKAVAAGDIDGDGNADIVTADGNGIYTWLGNGDGIFQAAVASLAAGADPINGFALADIDGDDSPELAIPVHGANAVKLCGGDGAGGWTCGASVAVPAPDRVALIDLNNDGAPDMVVTTDHASGGVADATDAYVFLNDGAGGFNLPAAAILPVAGSVFGGGWDIAAGDVSGDGETDLVFGSAGPGISVFAGNGDGTFGAATMVPVSTSGSGQPKFVSLADVNGDGAPDIFATNANINALITVSVLVNNGDGTFAPAVNHVTGFGPNRVLTLDMDGDGLVDIVTANQGLATLLPDALTVSVYLHNHAPVVVKAGALTVAENTTGAGTLTASDRERDPLTFAIVVPPVHGTVKLDAATGQYTYTPKADYAGSDSFSATAGDGLNTSAPVTVPITVQAVTPPGDNGSDTAPPSGNGGDDAAASDSGGGGGFGFLGGLLLLGALSRRRIQRRGGQ